MSKVLFFRLVVSVLVGCLLAVGLRAGFPTLLAGKFVLTAGIASLAVLVLKVDLRDDHLPIPDKDDFPIP